MHKCPRWIVFQLLEKCNLRCKMCYEWGENGSYFEKEDLKELDIEVVKRVINECSSASPYFELFGGEPLLYSQLSEVLYEMHKVDAKVDIPTNGTLLGDYKDILLKYPPKRIWVSIDGTEPYNDQQRGKGVYQKALNGMIKLHDEKKRQGSRYPELGVTMVVTPDNYLTIQELFTKELDPQMYHWFSIEFQLYITKEMYSEYNQLLKEKFGLPESIYAKGLIRDNAIFNKIDLEQLIKQIKNVQIYCQEKNINLIGYPKVIEKENLINFYTSNWNEMKEVKRNCSLPWAYTEISASGDVSPCHTFYDYSIGNVNQSTMEEIWNGDKIKSYRNVIRKGLLPICVACSRYYSDL